MAVNVSVNRLVQIGIAEGAQPGFLAAQRLFRHNYAMTDAKVAEVAAKMAETPYFRLIAYHMGQFGGQQPDWAPNSKTTLASSTIIGATTISVAAAMGVDSSNRARYTLRIGDGATREYREISAVSGTTFTLSSALSSAHSSGAPVYLRQFVGTSTGNQGMDEVFGVGRSMPGYTNAPGKAAVQILRENGLVDAQGVAILYGVPGAIASLGSGVVPHRKQYGTNAQATGTVSARNGGSPSTATLTGQGLAEMLLDPIARYGGGGVYSAGSFSGGVGNAASVLQAVSFGQEQKGVLASQGGSARNTFFADPSGTSAIRNGITTESWYDRIDGFTYLKKAMNSLGGFTGVETWAFHLNLWDASTAAQADTFIANVKAGKPATFGYLESMVDTALRRLGHDAVLADTNGTWPTLPATLDPTLLPDRITFDCSIASGTGRWAGNYTETAKRVELAACTAAELKRRMVLYWGASNVKPRLPIEDYFNWDISDPTARNFSDAQQGALLAAIGLHEALDCSHRFPWEPQAGDQQATSSGSEMWNEHSYFNPYSATNTPVDPPHYYPIMQFEIDRANALPPGTRLWETTTDDPNVHAQAGDDKLVIVNLSGTSLPLSVSVTGAESPPATGIGGMTQLVIDLPSVPASEAHDDFNRTVTGGLGAADVGGSYEIAGLASDYNVSPGAATFRMAPGQTRRADLPAVFLQDVHANVDSAMDKLAVGGSEFAYLSLRELSIDGDMYYAIVERTVTNTIKLGFGKRVGGVESIVVALATIGRETNVAATFFTIVAEAEGTSPTTLRAKVYRVGTAVPGSWDVTGTDSETVLQVAGRVGFRAFLSGTATNTPVTASIANFDAVAIGAPPPPPPPLPEAHMALTNYGANKQADEWYGSGSPAAYYLQLWQGDPGPLGTASAPVLGRIQVLNDAVHWPIAANRRKVNGLKLSWGSTAGQNTNPDATWVTIWDAPSGGNMIEKVPLRDPLKTADAVEVAMQPGQLELTR